MGSPGSYLLFAVKEECEGLMSFGNSGYRKARFALVCSSPCTCRHTGMLWAASARRDCQSSFPLWEVCCQFTKPSSPKEQRGTDYLKSASVISRGFIRGRTSCPFPIPHKHPGRYTRGTGNCLLALSSPCCLRSWLLWSFSARKMRFSILPINQESGPVSLRGLNQGGIKL